MGGGMVQWEAVAGHEDTHRAQGVAGMGRGRVAVAGMGTRTHACLSGWTALPRQCGYFAKDEVLRN